MPGETVRQIIDKLEMDHEAEMLAEAAEAEEAAAESYLDAQADERRQERPHG
jgi:hypothetical protein